ncbi:Helix-turn-helix domain-containing protein [Thermomonospora echinospora]|uniref:Helix-turn-helix domain-containing protein n=1 Tax=Thermomonospora echinospora TaxID=1992 RepID=A0A1H6DDI0_9ACTN|nr:helix-turn-helix domain-containing protein [Thermomonospora echinospora]SEG82815.1 Helix-turn-helix domain-containing protein [Thermomonospora echinospora]
MPGPGNVGERVRNLRLTRRMSQAQLAGHDLSDSYISLIESGKRTPTPAVLRLLAERLGCTSEYLAEGIEPEQRAHLEVRERYARLSLSAGDASAALAGFDDVISGSDDPELTTRAHWGRAQALEALGRVEAAIGVFEELREQAERDPGRASALPVLVALARCYHAVGDLGQAIALGERVLARLHDLELTAGEEHTEASRVLLLAYVDRADPERAHRLGREVLGIGAPAEGSLSDAYRHASAVALEQGAVGDALHLADQALAAQDEGARIRAQARLHMAAARALLRGVPPFGDAPHPAAEAMELLNGAASDLRGAEAIDCVIETARALVLLGEPDQAVEAVERELAGMSADSSVPSAGPVQDRAKGAAAPQVNGRGETGGEPPYTGRDDLGFGASEGHHGPGAQRGGLALGADARAFQLVQARLIVARARLAQNARGAALEVLRDTAERLDHLGREGHGRPVAHLLRELGELFEAAEDATGATAAYRRALEAAGLRPSFRHHSALDPEATSDVTLPTAT